MISRVKSTIKKVLPERIYKTLAVLKNGGIRLKMDFLPTMISRGEAKFFAECTAARSRRAARSSTSAASWARPQSPWPGG